MNNCYDDRRLFTYSNMTRHRSRSKVRTHGTPVSRFNEARTKLGLCRLSFFDSNKMVRKEFVPARLDRLSPLKSVVKTNCSHLPGRREAVPHRTFVVKTYIIRLLDAAQQRYPSPSNSLDFLHQTSLLLAPIENRTRSRDYEWAEQHLPRFRHSIKIGRTPLIMLCSCA